MAADKETENKGIELRISPEEARRIASLLRYAVSLNTAAGLVSPERRLTTCTYRAVELAALVLEGKPLEEARREAEAAWTGSLEEDHRHALDLLQSNRDALQSAMTGLMRPEQLTEYLEISHKQLLELLNAGLHKPTKASKE